MFRFISFILFFVNSVCASNAQTYVQEIILSESFVKEQSCVKKVEGNKIYLVPEKIQPAPNGLFLNLKGNEYVPLSQLNSDGEGCYVEFVGEYGRDHTCPSCGETYYIRCANPKCPSRGK